MQKLSKKGKSKKARRLRRMEEHAALAASARYWRPHSPLARLDGSPMRGVGLQARQGVVYRKEKPKR